MNKKQQTPTELYELVLIIKMLDGQQIVSPSQASTDRTAIIRLCEVFRSHLQTKLPAHMEMLELLGIDTITPAVREINLEPLPVTMGGIAIPGRS